MEERAPTLELGSDLERLCCEDVERVARFGGEVSLSGEGRAELELGEGWLDELIVGREAIYGLTTGFGPLASAHVQPEHRAALQRGLVLHLASGVGPPLDYASSRALVLSRAAVLSLGHSCAPARLVDQLCGALNAGLAPVVPSLGTVGASGDLTPLAHMTLGLMGEGELWVSEGVRAPALEALAERGLSRVELRDREGLALVNGTSAMTGLAALSGARFARFLERALDVAVGYGEAMGWREEAWDRALGEVRPHPGQRWAHEALLGRLEGRAVLAERGGSGLALASRDRANGYGVTPGEPLVQDAYSLRCVPQVLGAVWEVAEQHRAVVERELLSVTDNPVFLRRERRVVHGGNFHGQPVAFASDALWSALVMVMVWLERVAARLCDQERSAGLPPFLVWRAGEAGLSSGFMGAQVTASALVAHARTRSVPAAVQSIATNAENQDVVSMGTIGALRVYEGLDRAYELLAIVSMMVAQALELRAEHAGVSLEQRSVTSRALVARVRASAPRLVQDRALSAEIAALARALDAP